MPRVRRVDRDVRLDERQRVGARGDRRVRHDDLDARLLRARVRHGEAVERGRRKRGACRPPHGRQA